MKCYICGKGIRIKGANKKKVAGVWVHKICPIEAARRKERKNEKKNKATK